MYINQGYVKTNNWWYLPKLIVIAFAGSYIGKKLLNTVSQETFKKIVRFFLFITGLMMTLKALAVFLIF